MSKNKIPSSEVPEARPLPAAGTSPFPCAWRSQAGLTQSRTKPGTHPDPGRAPGCEGWQRSAPSCGRGRHCGPREEAAAKPASPATQQLAVPAGPPSPPRPAGAERPAPGAPTSARPSPPPRILPSGSAPGPPGSPTAARRKCAATAVPPDPAARGVSSSGQVSCDVAARRGRLRAGGRAAGPGGADPGRGAAPQLDGWGRPERRRRRTVSDRPTLGARATHPPPGPDPGPAGPGQTRASGAEPGSSTSLGFSSPLSPCTSLPIAPSPPVAPSLSSSVSVSQSLWLSLSFLLLSPFPLLSGSPSPVPLCPDCGPLTSACPAVASKSGLAQSAFGPRGALRLSSEAPVRAWRSWTRASFPPAHLHQGMRKLRQGHRQLKVTAR